MICSRPSIPCVEMSIRAIGPFNQASILVASATWPELFMKLARPRLSLESTHRLAHLAIGSAIASLAKYRVNPSRCFALNAPPEHPTRASRPSRSLLRDSSCAIIARMHEQSGLAFQ